MAARLLSFPLLLLFLAGLTACPVSSGNRGSDDDDLVSANDDDSGSDDDDDGDDDDATTPPPPESECQDGLDNDSDGLTDCEDPDCAAVVECTWPTALQHSGSFDYEASLLAELGGYDDCVTQFTAPLVQELVEAMECPTCDRTFTGPMSYPSDNCPAGDEPRPTSVSYGLVFFNALQWEVFVQDAQQVWSSVGFAGQAGEDYTLTRTDEVDVDGTDAGDLTTTLTFSPSGD